MDGTYMPLQKFVIKAAKSPGKRKMPPTIPHTRDVANAAGGENNTPSDTTPALSVVLLPASLAIVYWVLFRVWFWLYI